jgi:hypothetical protein
VLARRSGPGIDDDSMRGDALTLGILYVCDMLEKYDEAVAMGFRELMDNDPEQRVRPKEMTTTTIRTCASDSDRQTDASGALASITASVLAARMVRVPVAPRYGVATGQLFIGRL